VFVFVAIVISVYWFMNGLRLTKFRNAQRKFLKRRGLVR